MRRFAVFVDAGYLLAAGAEAICGTNVRRQNISLPAVRELIQALVERASTQCSIPDLLRVYWYDAMQGPRISLEHSTVAHQAGVKLRLGSLNNAGEQKGVDSLIVTDLIELARNGAIVDAVLVSGDEDLRVAVQVAQTFGVRVHILAVGDASRNVSTALQMEADSVDTLEKPWLKKYLSVRMSSPAAAPSPAQPPTLPPLPPQGASVEEAAASVAKELLQELHPGEIEALRSHFASNQTVPPEYDRKLIAKTARIVGRQFESTEMRKIRGVFVRMVKDATSLGAQPPQ
jgi:NYN domain